MNARNFRPPPEPFAARCGIRRKRYKHDALARELTTIIIYFSGGCQKYQPRVRCTCEYRKGVRAQKTADNEIARDRNENRLHRRLSIATLNSSSMPSAYFSQPILFSTTALALRLNDVYNAGSATSDSTAMAISSGARDRTSRAFSRSVMTSWAPAPRETMTGVPHAIASNTAKPHVCGSLAKMK